MWYALELRLSIEFHISEHNCGAFLMTYVLVCDRYTDSAALLQQVQLYEEGLMRDREEAAMPGGVDITDHQQVFSPL